jgi:UDP-N-acetylmuramyl pentapeptide phosphotransferase/UDP-N-acetylglucosamine-1-phosphate transferase
MTAVNLSTLMVTGLVSLLLGIVLVLTQRWHGQLTHDQTQGIQKFHTTPTPRVGGIPIFAALLAGLPAAAR